MVPKATSFFCFLLLVSVATAAKHNITAILEQYPEYETFNSLLSQTHLAREINNRTTVTVLVLDNAAAGGFSGIDNVTLRNFVAVHVILDYYDITKFRKMKSTVQVTTLFQTTGTADASKGFVNITKLPEEKKLGFRSAMKGAPFNSFLQKEVMANPYTISVLQVSGIILTRDIDQHNFTAPPPPPKKAAPPPKPDAEEPSAADDTSAEGPAEAPGPAAEAPAPGPMTDGPAPVAEKAADEDTAESPKSGADVAKVGLRGFLLGVAAVVMFGM